MTKATFERDIRGLRPPPPPSLVLFSTNIAFVIIFLLGKLTETGGEQIDGVLRNSYGT